MIPNDTNAQEVVRLVPATPNDIDTLIEQEHRLPRTHMYSPCTSREEWVQAFADGPVFFICYGDVIVGNLSYEPKSAERVYLSGIFIEPAYQGRGVARAALQMAFASLERYPRIDLVTHPENPAVALYQSLGFVVESRVENCFGDGEPRLVLALEKRSDGSTLTETGVD